MRKNNRWLLALLLFVLVISGGVAGYAQAGAPYADQNMAPVTSGPGSNYIWVEPYTFPNGAQAPGYWRPIARKNCVWVNDTVDSQGNYIQGYWMPSVINPPAPNFVWEHGFYLNGIWIGGHWRDAVRPGWDWIPTHFDAFGNFISGHWMPSAPGPTGMIWVPGHWNLNDIWIDGHWRYSSQPGMIWIEGHYNRDGFWVEGHWREIE